MLKAIFGDAVRKLDSFSLAYSIELFDEHSQNYFGTLKVGLV